MRHTLFLKLLTREPTTQERQLYTQHLSAGFDSRITQHTSSPTPTTRTREKYVSWSNHLDSEATTVRMEQEKASRRGEPSEREEQSSSRVAVDYALFRAAVLDCWATISGA